MAVLSTCKKIHIEASPIFLQRTKIHFDQGLLLKRLIRLLSETGFLAQVRRASIEIPIAFCPLIDSSKIALWGQKMMRRFNSMSLLERLDIYVRPSSRYIAELDGILLILGEFRCGDFVEVGVHYTGTGRLLKGDVKRMKAAVARIGG